jgi:hypothetical protein
MSMAMPVSSRAGQHAPAAVDTAGLSPLQRAAVHGSGSVLAWDTAGADRAGERPG